MKWMQVLSCPEPVMLTAAALKKHKGESVKVLVSEPHTRMNVEKYAKSQGKTATVTEKGLNLRL